MGYHALWMVESTINLSLSDKRGISLTEESFGYLHHILRGIVTLSKLYCLGINRISIELFFFMSM